MNTREKFLKIAHFELKNEIFIGSWFQWYWYDALVNWVSQGASSEILSDEHRAEYFKFERVEQIDIKSGMLCLGKSFGPPYVPCYIPLFDRKIISEDERVRIVINEGGIKCKEYKNQPERMPQWLDYPVKDKKSWNDLKKRLDPHEPTRYPPWWKDKVRCWKERDYVLGLSVGSFFGMFREYIGFENLCIMYHDNPSLILEIAEWMEYFEMEIIKKVIADVKLDYVYYWEDIAFKTGSLISPQIFKKFMMPYYKRINNYLRSNGIDIILVDSDGLTEELIPLWLESGINGHYPLEVTANMDAVKLRKKYGKNLILSGNIDKRALADSKIAIEKEVFSKVPYLISEGGYFPSLDHFCPPDVSYENYKFYLELLRSINKS
jgi:hypothetical protein